MYRNTRFGEVMKALPRGVFDKLVQAHAADKHSKGFRCWDQLMAMVYGQLTGSRSLRELEVAFNSHRSSHYHLGTRSVKRSTLADANAKRDERLYDALCQLLLRQVHHKARREITDMLYLLDSTPIPLKGLGYDDWAAQRRTHRTQGLKVHVLYSPEQAVPMYSQITAANVNDIEDARNMDLEPGATYVFDKGYCDYNWWYELNQTSALFVTRFKRNAAVKTLETDKPTAAEAPILADEKVLLTNRCRRQTPQPLRHAAAARHRGSGRQGPAGAGEQRFYPLGR